MVGQATVSTGYSYSPGSYQPASNTHTLATLQSPQPRYQAYSYSSPTDSPPPKGPSIKCALLIGNSQIDQIQPNKFSERTRLIKITKYTIEEAHSPPEVVDKMIKLLETTKTALPHTKILVSLGKPRNDGFQGAVHNVNNMLQQYFPNNVRVKLCHHENLQYNGTLKAGLYLRDQYHLSQDGTKVLAANIRYAIEGRRPDHQGKPQPLMSQQAHTQCP